MPNHLVRKRKIVLGVTGGIAAYKAASLASSLAQAGAQVDVVMTEAATRFVCPLTFEALTGRRVFTDMFDLPPNPNSSDLRTLQISHIELALAADLLLIAPATANTLAKLAHGQADNLLSAIALACPAPLMLAPAMESHMLASPATQANLETLVDRGAVVVGPVTGHLASGASGKGRMSEPDQILQMVRVVLGRMGDLTGYRVVVSAGGTLEAIDPVRFIGNHSSGKMGYALALAARDRGAQVTLVTAPTDLPDPVGIELVRVVSAWDMRDSVIEASEGVDVLVMAAAVADYQPLQRAEQKIKKSEDEISLRLEPTPDILTDIGILRSEGQGPKVAVGFAAETENLLENARRKMRNKQLDMIVANDLTAPGAGFAVDTNRVSILWPSGMTEPVPLMSKAELAHLIWDRVSTILLAESVSRV